MLLSIGVDDVDETLGRVEALGGSVRSGPNNMPGGSPRRLGAEAAGARVRSCHR